MTRRPVSLLTTAVLAVGLLVLTAGPARAQHGVHGGFHMGFRDGFRDGFVLGASRFGTSFGTFRPGAFGFRPPFAPRPFAFAPLFRQEIRLGTPFRRHMDRMMDRLHDRDDRRMDRDDRFDRDDGRR
jgi:hypothetical protein